MSKFFRKDREEEQEMMDHVHHSIAQTEAALEAKKAERLEKKRLKEVSKKRAQQEKLVAPILCLLTVLISAALFVFFGSK